jgi:Family of unknown function (DUF6807)
MRDWLRIRPLGAAALALVLAVTGFSALAEDASEVAFQREPGKVQITIGGKPVALYVFEDSEITRPYFAHVHAPDGLQVTRNYPPVAGQDSMDHSTFHPGIWLAFGDLSGSDSWRLRAPVVQESFIEEPGGGPGRGSFAVRNRYLDQEDNDKVVCKEQCKYTISARPAGYLLTWDSTFSSDDEFYFGDQEEMGLGFRVATPLRVEAGDGSIPPGNGTMMDAKGRKNGAEIGGNSSAWCDYSGTLAGQHVGMTLFCYPDNFRPSWFHARDYGFLEANPFGRAAFHKGEPSKVVVKPGEKLRLRYGILIHSGPEDSSPDLSAAYQDYLEVAGQ